MELLCFDLGPEAYGVELRYIREIAPFHDVVRVPSTPSFVRGLLPLLDAPVPVVDLARKFGIESANEPRHASVVVADARIDGVATPMGFLVDARSRVLDVGERDVESVPELGAGLRVEFLRGVARVEGRLVFIVDLDRALSATEAEAVRGLATEHMARIEAARAGGPAPAARSLASDQKLPYGADGDRGDEYVVFSASGEKLALGLSQVLELLQYGTVIPVPGARDWIRGVTNRRGQVTAVIDLARCLGLTPAPVTKRSCLLVLDVDVEGARTAVGLAIDDIVDVVSLRHAQIDAAPQLGARIPADHLLGVASVGNGFVSLLDVARLLPLVAASA